MIPKITGVGGIFLRGNNNTDIAAWYKRVLLFEIATHGSVFPFAQQAADGYSLLSLFGAETDYLAPSTLPLMINLRVQCLDELVAHIKNIGEPLLGEPISDPEWGKFAWVMDPNGIKIELWEQPELTKKEA